MSINISFELGFYGENTQDHEIDLYDIAHSLIGFQRSLALTTHLVLHNEIITQAPSLKGASIFAQTPEAGSWKLPATVAITATTLFALGTAPKDTPLGHLVFSAYDYVVKQSLGEHVDFDKSLGKIYEDAQENDDKIPKIDEYRFDSLIEKCESSMRDLHRPISGRGTASQGRITVGKARRPIGVDLTENTFEYVQRSIRLIEPDQFVGHVSSYNANTFNGRIFLPSVGHTIPFHLVGEAKVRAKTFIIANSLASNTQRSRDSKEIRAIFILAHQITSKNRRLKRLEIINVSNNPFK